LGIGDWAIPNPQSPIPNPQNYINNKKKISITITNIIKKTI